MIYQDAPKSIAQAIEQSEIVEDFLPSPTQLVGKVTRKRVTLMLSQRSIDRFKSFADAHGGKYQTMISEVVDAYAMRI
ncbi:MAG: BrnA antitoxin family protein [Propionibacteriaceae bacterium]|jgi:predicted DNA binding CopG/RHH family protein|nr:BrnA antitoxin family protein [Propionibacteriaceae bacterium]